jgi:hypothetical protein
MNNISSSERNFSAEVQLRSQEILGINHLNIKRTPSVCSSILNSILGTKKSYIVSRLFRYRKQMHLTSFSRFWRQQTALITYHVWKKKYLWSMKRNRTFKSYGSWRFNERQRLPFGPKLFNTLYPPAPPKYNFLN